MSSHLASLPGFPAVRAVRDADGEAVARLIAACFGEYPGCLFYREEFPELEAPATWTAGRGTRMWVLDGEPGVIATCICATPDDHGAVELHKFNVTANLRGTGLARQLLGLVLGVAEAEGVAAVFLWRDTRFLRAQRFYEKTGFVCQTEQRMLHDISATEEYHYRFDTRTAL